MLQASSSFWGAMGSSGSKVKQAGEAELRKIRPFLHRRYEELKNRKQRIVNAIKKDRSTHSRKNLRKEQDEDATCDSFLETETMQIPMVTPPRKTEPAKVVPLPLPDCKIEEVIQVQEKERNNDDDEEEEKYYDYEEEEEKEKMEVEFGRHIIPSSPSFRIYCIPEVNLKEESEESECLNLNYLQMISSATLNKSVCECDSGYKCMQVRSKKEMQSRKR